MKHKPERPKKHVDALSQFPVDTEEEEEEIGKHTIMQLPTQVQDKVREINQQTQQGDPNCKALMSLNGYCFEKRG